MSLCDIDLEKSLLDYGLNSFVVLSCIQRLENSGVSLPSNIFETFMTESMNSLVKIIINLSAVQHTADNVRKRRRLDNSPTNVPSKAIFRETDNTEPSSVPAAVVVSRAQSNTGASACAQEKINFMSVRRTRIVHSNYDWAASLQDPFVLNVPGDGDISDLTFEVKFRYNLGKCIDASPLLCSVR